MARWSAFAFYLEYFIGVVCVFMAASACMHLETLAIAKRIATSNVRALESRFLLRFIIGDLAAVLVEYVHALCFFNIDDHIGITT